MVKYSSFGVAEVPLFPAGLPPGGGILPPVLTNRPSRA